MPPVYSLTANCDPLPLTRARDSFTWTKFANLLKAGESAKSGMKEQCCINMRLHAKETPDQKPYVVAHTHVHGPALEHEGGLAQYRVS